MAITIIDHIPSPEVVKRCLCRNCGVTLEYTPNDVRRESGRDYTGYIDWWHEITCPKCGKSVTVPTAAY